jgi:iron complex outermembrane receptor protein
MSASQSQTDRPIFKPSIAFIATALATLLSCSPGVAQNLSDTIVISASRVEQRALDTAASVNVVDTDKIQEGQAQANLSEPLARVPGIFALDRQNYAQDLLISSRGFGANSTFGARGIKIYVDGIPGTVADGQGQISHIDLASAERIEVLRGPFSALYGNAAGGVINVFTESGKPGTNLTPYTETGSFGLHKYGIKVTGEQGKVNYVLDTGKFETDGFRRHSAADRDNQNAKLRLRISDDTSVQLVANRVSLSAQDPLGLTAAQMQQDRTQAGNYADAYDTRKTVEQTQGGMVLAQRIDANNSLAISPYYGDRHTVQYQTGSSASGSPAAVNGVINLSRIFYGIDAKWLYNGQTMGLPLHVATGIESNRNDDHRLTYNNLGGIQQAPLGSNQDLSQSADNLDGYLQADLRANDRTTLMTGVRHSRTSLNSLSNNGGAGAGSNTYQDTTAMVSAQYYVRDDTNVYVTYGTGFDTPTLNQAAYSPAFLIGKASANTGNFGLLAATTRQLEAGVKSDIANWATAHLAVFFADTSNDIVVAASNSGRTAFTNAPKTSRKGVELSVNLTLPYQLQADVAYTLLDTSIDQSYLSYSGATPVTINAGNRIPGVPSKGLFVDLKWQKTDKTVDFALEGRAVGNMAASDTNGAFAGGYCIMNARIVTRQQAGDWTVTEFARVDNLFDKSYVGSLIVNQASRQFYEPAPGRKWVLGAKATYHF